MRHPARRALPAVVRPSPHSRVHVPTRDHRVDGEAKRRRGGGEGGGEEGEGGERIITVRHESL